jgi:hypothetical protein
MVKYSVVDGVKCVDLDVNVTLTVDIKGWSRIFQYANRDLILKEDKRLRLYDAETNNIVAIYEESLNKKSVIRKKL